MNKDSLGDRMKKYEGVSKYRLLDKTPVILRVDGKAFHTFTRGMNKPYDEILIEAMVLAGEQTAKEMMGFVLGYHQSDEFSFYINNTKKLTSEAWFGNEVQKLCSITASTFTANFNEILGTRARFDCRAFNIPLDDVPNYFIWRQQDWIRNSVQMLTGHYFSHKQLQNKSQSDMHEMLHGLGINWGNLNNHLKNGTFISNRDERFSSKQNYESLMTMVEYLNKDNDE